MATRREITEADVEDYLSKRVVEAGGEVRKLTWLGRQHAPDRLVMLNGAHFVELKKPGEKPRPGQVREHERMRKHGLDVAVLDTYYEVDQFMERIINDKDVPRIYDQEAPTAEKGLL